MNMDNSGVWVGKEAVIVYAKVNHSIWVREDEDGEDHQTERIDATHLVVFMDGANMDFNKIGRNGIYISVDDNADGFVLGLATYWETRAK